LRDYRRMPEHELVTLFKTNDPASETELYKRYQCAILRYCSYLMADQDAAKDATQDTFLTASQHIKDLRDGLSFRGWLFRIARNTCLMDARRTSRLLRLEDTDEVRAEDTPLDIALNGELKETIQHALTLLRPIYSEALLLREYESMTYHEIAEATESSLASVKFRIHKARRALAEILGSYLDERTES
jgi:RNA polymerase sigma-70 factor, ECF subfamily